MRRSRDHLDVQLVFALVALLLLLSYDALRAADSQGRGYTSRPCGFDLDDNGVVGEAADCNVCDGTTGTGVVTTDFDGDGDDEVEIYVNSSGSDTGSCGGPSDPCATIGYAMANRTGTGSFEDAICFSGTQDVTSPIEMEPGQAGTRTITAEWPYEYDRKRPTDPLMVVGWDEDNDGEYTPYDTDDTATLTNSTNGQIFYLREGDSNIEWAHFTQGEASSNTFYHPSTSSGSAGTNYLYVHDLELTDSQDADWWTLNRSSCDGGTSYVEIDNILMSEMTDTAGGSIAFLLRGNPTNCAGISQFYTLAHVTANDTFTTGQGIIDLFDFWGNAFDATPAYSQVYVQIVSNRAVFDQANTGSPNQALGTIAQGVSDVVVRNNFCDGCVSGVVVEHAESNPFFAAGAPMRRLVIDANEIWLMNDQGDKDTFGINILDNGNEPQSQLVSLSITNNIIWCRDAGKATDRGTAIYASLGLDEEYEEDHILLIEGNTVDECERNGFLWIDEENLGGEFDNITVRGNTITDLDSLNYNIDYLPGNYSGSYNSFDSTSNGYFFGEPPADRSLATMKSTYGEDSSSTECATTYTDGANGDFSLDSGDTCSKGQGAALTNPLDLRGNVRAAPYDRGAIAFSIESEATPRFLPFIK